MDNKTQGRALGLVHVYTGGGKGKTTAALGLAIRALGCGFRVLCVQFFKGARTKSGEANALEKFEKMTLIRHKEAHPFFWSSEIRRDKARMARKLQKLRSSLSGAIEDTARLIKSRSYDLVILDEIINAASSNLIDEKIILDLIIEKPKDVELVLTGRGASQKLIELADYVTIMQEVKHPFTRGIKARRGIEK